MDFKDKWVWITGASAGLGEALAYAFADEGANLILSSRKQEELERVKSNCNTESQVIVQALDVTNYEMFQPITKKLLAATGGIDILINNAGISQRGLVKDTSLDVDKRIMEINYFGAVGLTKAVLPSMLERKSGHIIAMSSVVGYVGTPMRSTYAASKHALHGFYDSLRAETVDDGIKVSLILPGYIKTNISINAVTADGTPQNKMDNNQANGLLPEVFAKRALRGIKRGKHEILIGRTEMMAIYLKRFFPKLLARIVSRINVK